MAHVEAWYTSFPRVVSAFNRIFASCEIGYRKPKFGAFAVVRDEIGVDRASIIFFDDCTENIDAARMQGLTPIHVGSSYDVRRTIIAFGLLETELVESFE